MVLNAHKTLLFTTIFLLFVYRFNYVRTQENLEEVAIKNGIPEKLTVEVQGHENTSERKVRQFGFPLPPPPPFGFGVGYQPFPQQPVYYGPVGPVVGGGGFGGGGFGGGGFGGGGFQRTRVVTRTRTRVVDRYRGGGFGGGFYG